MRQSRCVRPLRLQAMRPFLKIISQTSVSMPFGSVQMRFSGPNAPDSIRASAMPAIAPPEMCRSSSCWISRTGFQADCLAGWSYSPYLDLDRLAAHLVRLAAYGELEWVAHTRLLCNLGRLEVWIGVTQPWVSCQIRSSSGWMQSPGVTPPSS